MTNIIHSDLYRARKGAAVRNAILGVLVAILVVGLAFFFIQNGAIRSMSENAMSNSQLSEGDRISLQEDIEEMDATMSALPQNGAQFARLVMAENIFAIFLLVISVVVLGSDFGAGAVRNTLSYETDRKKVYLGKFVVSVVLMLAMLLAGLVFSWILGSILFGFGGFSGAYFVSLLVTLALQMPIYLALLSFGQCLVAFTQKSGAAIAAYLLVVMLFSSVVQVLVALLPTVSWIARLDFLSGIKLVSMYQTAPLADIVAPVIMAAIVLVGTMVAGLLRYEKADIH